MFLDCPKTKGHWYESVQPIFGRRYSSVALVIFFLNLPAAPGTVRDGEFCGISKEVYTFVHTSKWYKSRLVTAFRFWKLMQKRSDSFFLRENTIGDVNDFRAGSWTSCKTILSVFAVSKPPATDSARNSTEFMYAWLLLLLRSTQCFEIFTCTRRPSRPD